MRQSIRNLQMQIERLAPHTESGPEKPTGE
jgi:hypothetical protein